MTMPVTDIPAGLTADQAAVVASQAAYQAQQQQLRAQLAAALIAIWSGVAAAQTFSPQAAAKFVDQLLPISLGAQRAMVAVTVAQLNSMVTPPTPITIAPAAVTGSALRGVDPQQYYERPFSEIKWRLSQGMPLGQAIDAGRRRAESIAQTDLQLAHTHTARSYIAETGARQAALQAQWSERRARVLGPAPTPGPPPALSPRGTVVGYRRVLSQNPNHCALCVLASTQRYHREDLMPIHPGCGCTVMPLFSSETSAPSKADLLVPGAYRLGQHVIDPSLAQEVHNIVRRDLGESYVDAGARLGDAHYRDIIIVNNHGELGPVLGVRGQHFDDHVGTQDTSKPRTLGHQRLNPPAEPPPGRPAPINLDGL